MPSQKFSAFHRWVLDTLELYSISDHITENAEYEAVLADRLSGLRPNPGGPILEVQISGEQLPDWIQPLQFEKNLNSALDALQTTDALLKEFRELLLSEVQNNFMGGLLSAEENPAFLEIHQNLTDGINMDAAKDSLRRRISHSLIDLIEFSKAAKLGAHLLFKIPLNDPPGGGAVRGISIVRESLRGLLNQYRKIASREQTTTVSISMKRAKKKDGEWLSSEWPAKRSTTVGPTEHVFNIDLAESDYFERFTNPRIRKIGFQVIDGWSGRRRFMPKQRLKDIHGFCPQGWDLTLRDQSGGLPLADSLAERKHRVEDTFFSNVIGTRDPKIVSWSNNASLINVPPARKWSIELGEFSTMNLPARPTKARNRHEVLDVFMHFDISFMS